MLTYKTFKGGLNFANFEGKPSEEIEIIDPPPIVIIPLRQGFGQEVKPLVEIGDKVVAGQVIGRDDENVSSPVHATISGTVTDIREVQLWGYKCKAVYVSSAKEAINNDTKGSNGDHRKDLSAGEIEELLYNSGVTALGCTGIPTRFNSSIIKPDEVEHVIIHSISDQPYSMSYDILLDERKFYEGIRILREVMRGAKFHIAIDKDIFQKPVLGDSFLDVVYLKSKYPQAHEALLVKVVLGQDFPYGYSSANIGVVVLDLQAVMQIYDAVFERKPVIERVIAVCGGAIKEPKHVRVRIGTPIHYVLNPMFKEGTIPRVIYNNFLVGQVIDDLSLPIDRSFSQLIAIPEDHNREFLKFMRLGLRRDLYTRAFLSGISRRIKRRLDTNKHGEERPCISCGYCEEVCPVGILPYLLNRYIVRSLIDELLMDLHIFDCIQCGLCSYVCPSKIPLLKHIREGIERLTAMGCTPEQCILPRFENIRGIVDSYRGFKEI